MWDERYDTQAYIYGKQPNEFLVSALPRIEKGRVLSLAEGEGRNAVYMAECGYEVTGLDSSSVAKRKALKLAKEKQVSFDYINCDISQFTFHTNYWDGIVSVFFPLPPTLRRQLYNNIQRALRPGGILIVEAYTPDQIAFGTGGGSDPSTMQTKKSLEEDLAGMSFIHLEEKEREVYEGSFHTGLSSVVQCIAAKPA